ncbi:hypothetical protein [Shewanella sp. UCD-KL12]|uniref:tetratricopeptide repeat protein n=1 Tax=Shewanella sp. UCD-KL12 TaxID=1917163 RepID=UPI00097073D0|nr:hypothetical protein [Shewanella sp. UCD-KL12]
MRMIFLSLILIFLLSASSVNAQDQLALEIKIKETPILVFNELQDAISLPVSANSLDEFEAIASEQGYLADELKQKLQTLTRLYLNPSIKHKDKYNKAESLMALLESISINAYDTGYLQMLKGRYIARSQNKYQQALPHYIQALNLIENEKGLKSQLLKQLSHFHLGELHRILHQSKPAQVHLKLYRDATYQLGNTYLIAHAEATLGKYYNKQDQLSLALQHYGEALRLSNQLEKPLLKADMQLQLARVYRDLESWEEALQYAHEADKGFKALNLDRLRSHCMTVMAMVHANQGLWNQAIDYYLNAQQLDYNDQNFLAQALNYHNLGEAHFKNGNSKTAFEFLFKSNAIFHSRNSKHYLVYNDLLIAEVAVAQKDWPLADKHSALALENAENLQLLDVQIEALQYQAEIKKGLKQYEEAFSILDKLLTLSLSTPQKADDKVNNTASILAEQKLKLEITNLLEKQDTLNFQLGRSRVILITAIIFLLLVSLVSINQWRRKNALALNLTIANQDKLIEPVSRLPGYRGFIDELNASHNPPSAVALVSLTGQLNADLAQGIQCNSNMNQLQLEALKSCTSGNAYLIRPGLFILTLIEQITGEALLSQCREAIDRDYGDTQLHIGLLPLPLLMDPEIRLSTEVHYGAAQLTLAAAMSLGDDKDYYVSIKALNFAPSAIFSTPLYLHLEKGIVRGLLKVETNGVKDEIQWPRWKSHENIEIS